MVYVVATSIVKEGKMQEFLAVCHKLRPHVLEEKGCVEYSLTVEYKSPLASQEKMNKNRVTLIEKWETKKDLAAHLQAPHVKEFVPKLNALRESVSTRATVSA